MSKYHLTYQIETHPEGLTKEQLPDNRGACHAILLASIIFPPDGSYSLLFRSADGRTGKELEDKEWFKVWIMLAKRLGDSKTLDENRRDFAQQVFEAIRKAVFAKKDP